MTTPLAEEAIFDPAPYDLPIPSLDGQKADKVILSFGGSMELDRTNEDDLQLIDSLLLGRDVRLSIIASVAGKGFTCSVKEDGDSTGYRVQLRVHTLTEK